MTLGSVEGREEGNFAFADGKEEGTDDGPPEGEKLGVIEGFNEGTVDGPPVGRRLGDIEGFVEGPDDGAELDGDIEGIPPVGVWLGISEGLNDGFDWLGGADGASL